MVIPIDSANVMHMPGVIDTTKNVGIKADNNDQFNVSKTGYSRKEFKI
jgi:hypothetical protein